MEMSIWIKSTHVNEINNVESFGHVNETIFMDLKKYMNRIHHANAINHMN
jgi:hypothetical protein